MGTSASQNMFYPIIHVIYHKMYVRTYILRRICRILREFYVFLGNFKGFLGKNF
jgi:hypothetical protein